MDIIQKLKKDKKYRRTIIVVIILIFFITQLNHQTQTFAVSQETCDESNTFGFIITESAYNRCKANSCAIQLNVNPSNLGIIGLGLNSLDWLSSLLGINYDFSTCKAKVSTGKYLLSNSKSEANQKCESNNAVLINDKLFTDTDVYICTTPDPDNVCSGWQKPIAGILDGIWKDNPFGSCSTKSYMVIGAGVLLFLVVI